jgi:hypothetical protein
MSPAGRSIDHPDWCTTLTCDTTAPTDPLHRSMPQTWVPERTNIQVSVAVGREDELQPDGTYLPYSAHVAVNLYDMAATTVHGDPRQIGLSLPAHEARRIGKLLIEHAAWAEAVEREDIPQQHPQRHTA